MKNNSRAVVFLTLTTLCSTIFISACSGREESNSANLAATSPKETLRVDIGAEIPTFDPAIAEDGNTYRVTNDLFAGLIDFDQSNRPIPGMARSWEITPDGKTYTFHLRDNLKFSDGSPIKASDFVYSWQRLVDPKLGSSYAFLLKDVVNGASIIAGKAPATSLGISAPDDKTVVVKLTHPSNAFLSYLTVPNVFVVSRANLEKFGESWTLPQNMVTSGAYTLKDHVLNGYILTQKNPEFYQESMVQIKYIKYFPFVDANASLSNFKTGDLDTTWQNVPIDQYAALKKQYPTELHTFMWERVNYLNFNMKLPKYANNLKLRQALALAIDRDSLAHTILAAGQLPLYSIVTPTIENGKYADIHYSWNNLAKAKRIAEARELFKEAGYGSNNPLTITLKYQTNDLTKKVMLAIMAMWQENLGVKVNLVNEELKVLFPDLKSGNYDMAEGRWGADYNSVTTYTPLFLCNSGNNRSHYCNPKYDALIAKAKATANPQQQEQLYKQALNIALADYPVIPLFEPTHQRLVSPRVAGYQIDNNYLDNVQSKWFTLKN